MPLKCFGIVWICINRMAFHKICDKYTKVDELPSPIKRSELKIPSFCLMNIPWKFIISSEFTSFGRTLKIISWMLWFFENGFTFILWIKVFALQFSSSCSVFGIWWHEMGEHFTQNVAPKFNCIHTFLLNSIKVFDCHSNEICFFLASGISAQIVLKAL